VESVIRSAVIALASLKLCQGVWPVKLIDLSEHVSAFKAFALYLVLLYIALVLWDALLLCASKPKVNWKQTWIWVTGPSLLCWGLLFYFAPSGPILKVSDITDWHALGARLRADDGGKNAPATRYLWEQLGDSQEAVRRLADGEAPDQESRDKDAVVGALNHVLRKEHLWRVKGFAAIDPKLADNMRSQDARGDTDPRIRVTANYALVAALFRPVPGPASRKSPLVTAVCSFGGESLLGMGAFAGVLVVVLAISFLSDLKNLVRSLAKREPHLYKEFAAELLDLIRFGPYYGEGLAGVPGPHKLKDTPRGYDGTPCLQDTCRFQPILDTVYRLESSE